jgi:hypothetical protein
MSGKPVQPDADSEDSPVDSRVMLGAGVFLFLAGAASGAMLYAFGLAGRTFNIGVMRGGLLTFGIISLLVALGVLIISGLIHLAGIIWPRSLTIWSEHRLLRKARKRTRSLINRRHSLQEEKARLTAKMQATYIMEKESARVANQQALTELRSALQTSMVRSCEIVFDHLNRTLDQYNELVHEIESSDLPALDKKELLDALSAKLNVEAQDQKRVSAQRMMEAAIWDVRFQKARSLAKKNVAVAIEYLQKIRQKTDTQRFLLQIDSLIRELSADRPVESRQV